MNVIVEAIPRSCKTMDTAPERAPLMPQLGGMTKSMVGPAVVTHMPGLRQVFLQRNFLVSDQTKLDDLSPRGHRARTSPILG